ncbi:MAG: RluA family pseudouridine synthase [Comamonadaceae bacterium]|nr:RluA family pseudouridine synthase [Comamonadaceae bacterium]
MTDQLADVAIVYVDNHLLVLDKPAGLLSVPGRGDDKQDCLSARVQRHYPQAGVVHRLDMATSGLMLMARSPLAVRQLNQAFASRSVQKHYEAVVDGVLAAPSPVPADDWSEINLPIWLDWPNRPRRVIDFDKGKPSQTRWRVIANDQASATTRLLLQPVTGRSHQLRVHLKAIGHPILGDALYAPADVAAKAARLLLHAGRLDLLHPVSHEPLSFFSPAPF